MADLAQGRLRQKLEALLQVLEGRVRPQHRVLLAIIMGKIRFLERAIAALDEEISRAAGLFAWALTLLGAISGIDQVAAAAILAEIGVDMDRFPSGAYLASWARVAPGNRQSAGKSLSSKTTKGNKWLRGILGEVAWAAIKTKGSSYRARYHRLARRVGAQKAVIAVMHHLLLTIHCMLATGFPTTSSARITTRPPILPARSAGSCTGSNNSVMTSPSPPRRLPSELVHTCFI